MPSLSLSEIQQLLPHREPFLFVDEIEDYELGSRIVGRTRFSKGHFFFQNGDGFVPETLLVEAAAQVGALLILLDPAYAGKIPYFMTLEKMKFHRRIRADETIHFKGTMEKMRGDFGILGGHCWIGEELVAEGTMRVALAERPPEMESNAPR